jgi:hypothetical protein
MMNVKFDVKLNLNFRKIEQDFEKSRKRVLMRSGALVRVIARRSIKTRKWRKRPKKARSGGSLYQHEYMPSVTALSTPGGLPFAHAASSKTGLKDIRFAYDPATKSVLVGTVKYPGSKSDAPSKIEHGGTSRKVIPYWARAAKRRMGIQSSGSHKFTQRVRRRPYMQPALKTFSQNYPSLWRDSLKG